MGQADESKRHGLRARLRDAHVAFELAWWRGEEGAARARRIGDRVWDWAEVTRLDAVVDAETISETAVRLALDFPLPTHLAGMIGAIADDLVRHEINEDTRVRDVVDQSLYDDGVALFVALEALRSRLIKRLLNSPVYTALASDVLYQGIKDYIFSDSGAIRSIPGVSRLIKGSSSAVSRRMPGLEAQVEKRVRAYIENNTAKTLARSEAYLLESLDEARIRAIADEIWNASADKPLSVAGLIDTDELQRLVDYGLAVWRSLRETEYLGVMVQTSVRQFFARYGDHTLAELAGHVGLDRETLADEIEALAPTLIEGLDETGLLARLVDDQIGAFYDSPAFDKALDDD
ncbi:hypothetical protein [Salinisphaera sp. Q1T1-3]|uniref:hypothetical protein n=1 Tax=Salinisphaera sp. Q1T1-3 TaxID=2321229 RepID=UPI000E72F57B|nr:hypothetical protein [Salinisphaera sp. Q1T1-3]RJS91402.1 hypothetical protein D3260_15465 [Salinisphaera sp. Q1T1-3]